MINPDDLDFSHFTPKDDFSSNDFTDEDGSDPLGVDEFIRKKARLYEDSNLSRVYTVRYDGKVVAFCAVSMSAIEVKKLADGHAVEGATTKYYPAMLLGQMGVDKKYRNKRIGLSICKYCLGLAVEVGQKVGCAALCLETNREKAGYYKKWGFVHAERQSTGNKVWMYVRTAQAQ